VKGEIYNYLADCWLPIEKKFPLPCGERIKVRGELEN